MRASRPSRPSSPSCAHKKGLEKHPHRSATQRSATTRLITPPPLILRYTGVALLLYKRNLLYSYTHDSEARGSFYPVGSGYLCFVLGMAQFLLAMVHLSKFSWGTLSCYKWGTVEPLQCDSFLLLL